MQAGTSSAQGRTNRDRGITALILGFFAGMWFGWSQAEPSELGGWLTAGGITGIGVAIAGLVVAVRSPGGDSPMGDPRVRRQYNIIVGIEFGAAGVGAALLGVLGAAEFIPVLVGAVVAAHFVPLAPVLRDRTLLPLAGVMGVVTVLGLLSGLLTDIAPSLVIGAGSGAALLVVALLNLAGALAKNAAPRPRQH